MDSRLTTRAARVFLLVVAIACIAGVGAGWRTVLTGLGQLGSVPALVACIVAIVVGGALARRGHSPAVLLVRIPPRVFAIGIFVFALGTSIWAHDRVHKWVPQLPDEFGYLHTARTFAAGEVVADSPPVRDFFYVSWGVHDRGKWYAVFPPGYPAALSVGVLAGVPWLVNPLIGALLALLLWRIAKRIFGGDTAASRAAPLLYIASWSRLMLDGSFMAHSLAALAAAGAMLGWWEVIAETATARWRWAVLAGVSASLLLATRQLDAIVIIAVLAPTAIYAIARKRAVFIAIALAASAPGVTAYLAYNHTLTGEALLPPQQRYIELKEKASDCFRLGFGPRIGECPITQSTNYGPDGYQPRHAVMNTRLRLDALLTFSFGWSPLALLPILAMFAGAIRGHEPRRRALCASVFVGAVFAYALFFFHGVDYGARFYYFAFPWIMLLSARALHDIGTWLPATKRGTLAGGVLSLLLPTVCVIGIIGDEPAVQEHCGDRKYLQNGAVPELLGGLRGQHRLVFVDSLTISAAMDMHPTDVDRNDPLVVRDFGQEANAAFARLHPDRKPALFVAKRIRDVAYPASAPMHHEGGALYPLDRSWNGFGVRTPQRSVALSHREALQFTFDGPGAFEVPIWGIVDDAGTSDIVLDLVHDPKGAAVSISLDKVPVGSPIDTAGPAKVVQHRVPAFVAPGLHWLGITAIGARRGQVVLVDDIEIRPTQRPKLER